MNQIELEWIKLELIEDDECGRMQPLREYLARCSTEIEQAELRDWYERGYTRCRPFFDELEHEEAECRESILQAFAGGKI